MFPVETSFYRKAIDFSQGLEKKRRGVDLIIDPILSLLPASALFFINSEQFFFLFLWFDLFKKILGIRSGSQCSALTVFNISRLNASKSSILVCNTS